MNILPLIIKTHKASTTLQHPTDAQLKKMLNALAAELIINTKQLIKENAKDLAKKDADDPRNDRLLLNEQRI